MPAPKLDHPTLPLLKAAFPDVKLLATEFRGQTTVIVPKDRLHEVMRHLREGKTACVLAFRSGMLQELPAEVVAEADRADAEVRMRARKAGTNPLAGPPVHA